MIIDFNSFTEFKPNNKYKIFHLDTVEKKIDNSYEIINTNRNQLIIVGILDLKNKTVYGYTANNRAYKLFFPLNKNFPKFIVSESNKFSYQNKIILIKYKSWNNDLPVGEIYNTLGTIDSYINNLYSKSLLYYNGYLKIINPKYKFDLINLNKKYFQITENLDYKYDFLLICNIDPFNCSDIDDVISLHKTENNVIGIHIIDIVKTLKILDLNLEFITNFILDNNLYVTTYTNTEQINIINKDFIDHFLSLKPNNKRFVWSLYLHIDDNYNIVNYEIKQELIENRISLTYNDVENMLFLKKNTILQTISNFCIKYGKEFYKEIYSMYDYHINNSHYIISLLMTIFNHYVGNLLLDNPKTIYRTILNEYSIYTLNDKNNYHSNLKLDNYLHFTSPIRRFVDLYNQILLYNKFNKDQINLPEISISNINIWVKEHSIILNYYKKLILINKIHNCKLLSMNINNNKLILKWIIDNIKFYDYITNPYIEIESDGIIFLNRLNLEQKIKLIIGKNYNLKITLESVGFINMPKFIINYFTD